MGTPVGGDRLYPRHAEAAAELPVGPREAFEFLDDHRNLSSHMESSRSPMMAGGAMQLILDEKQGRAIGSHIVMRGKVLGFDLFVDEIVTERVPDEKKTWETVEDRLVVIGAYRLGFRIAPRMPAGSTLTVWIDYDLPSRRRWLGRLGGSMYARWCLRQMLDSARSHFT
ncbi:SRPBCC family protein [Pseudolysinimonas yzui]|uniref:Polyketide cyclase n=1 Tax=Pseudolysinimonas yzui TaxID=2708254 RepID=A0A8J3M2J8_9MICO|nr:SRPBCC family protein [Pseudolysinimonas yzui]GHF23728.1 polyketide cyclase [Pseudolysinimonas yzui]